MERTPKEQAEFEQWLAKRKQEDAEAFERILPLINFDDMQERMDAIGTEFNFFLNRPSLN